MFRTARALAVAAAFGLLAQTFAQESKPLNLSFKLGNFKPQFSGARSDEDKWPAFGIETRFKNLGVSTSNPGTSTYLTISVESAGSGDWRTTPLMLNLVARTNELYLFGGAGVAFSEEPRESDSTRIGFQVGAGWDFLQGKTPLFVEAKYFVTTKNDHFNGYGIYLGVRL